jgi:hypothetical protein
MDAIFCCRAVISFFGAAASTWCFPFDLFCGKVLQVDAIKACIIL